MKTIKLTEKELLALQDALNHIEDHENWMFDIEIMDGEGLEEAIKKVKEATREGAADEKNYIPLQTN